MQLSPNETEANETFLNRSGMLLCVIGLGAFITHILFYIFLQRPCEWLTLPLWGEDIGIETTLPMINFCISAIAIGTTFQLRTPISWFSAITLLTLMVILFCIMGITLSVQLYHILQFATLQMIGPTAMIQSIFINFALGLLSFMTLVYVLHPHIRSLYGFGKTPKWDSREE